MKKFEVSRQHVHSCLLRGLLCSTALAAAVPAFAQDQSGGGPADEGALQEITVVAQKRAQNLQDVPIAITAVSGDQLTASGAITPGALGSVVAGLAVSTTASFFAPHIRGIGTAAFGPSIENPVALYVDNVYYASQLIAPTDLNDVDQIAVLKGPQGTLFGRNATGGVIQMTTRRPEEDFGIELRTELDQYLTSRSFGYLTGKVADGLATNLSVKYTTQGDGWGKNLVDHSDTHKIDYDFSVRNKWRWTAGPDTTVSLSGDYSRYRNSLGPNLRPVPGAFPLTFVPTLNNGFGYTSSNPWDSVSYQTNSNKLQAGGGSLAVEQDLGFARATSISAYREYSFKSSFDAAGTAVPLTGANYAQKGHQFTQELQLVSKETKPVSWTVGAFYFHGKETPTGDVAVIYAPLTDPALGGFGGTVNQFYYNTPLTTDSVAGFGQLTWEVINGTRVTGGIRYTREVRHYDGYQSVFTDLSAAAVATTTVNARTTESKWSFRASVDQDIADGILLYGSWNRGFKSGGFNGLGVLPGSATPYKPEQLDAYEVGIKADLFGRSLRLNPAFFYYDYKNIQVTQFQASQTNILNGAKARLYGFDLDAAWSPIDHLTINGNLEWIKSKFLSFPNAPQYVPDPVNGGNIGPVPFDASGNQLAFTPKFTANIGINYAFDLSGAKIELNASDSYSSGFVTEPDGRLKQGSYNLLNTSVTWTAPDDRLTVTAWARNLLDKAVATQLSAFVNSDIVDYASPPRTYGVTVRYRFGSTQRH